MSEKDRQGKVFFGKRERFSDLINVCFYNGQQVVSANELDEMETEINESKGNREVVQRRRDLLKKQVKENKTVAVYGLELQSTIEKWMTLRMMEYDALTYTEMMKHQNLMCALISMVLYTGENRWSGSTRLSHLISIPEQSKGIVEDYGMHLFHALDIDVSKLRNPEMIEFFMLFQDLHRLERVALFEKYKNVPPLNPEVVDAVAVLSNCRDLERLVMVDKEGKKMCSNFDRIVKELKNEGRVEGLAEGKIEGVQAEKLQTIQRLCEMKVDLSIIACATALTVQQVSDVIVQHQFAV